MTAVLLPAERAERAERAVRGPRTALRPVVVSALAAALLLALATIAASSLDAEYADRVLPGFTVGGVAVGSLDAAALRARLATIAAERPPAAIEVALDGRAWLASDETLGLSPDLDAAMRAALGYGKAGPLALRLAAWRDALVGSVHAPLPLHATGDRLARWIDTVAREAERPVVEGSLAVGPDGLEVTPPAAGRYVDRRALEAALRAAPGPGDRRVALPIREIHPALDPARFADAVAAARTALVPLVVSAGGPALRVEPAALAALVTLHRVPLEARDAPVVPSAAFAPATRLRIVVEADASGVAALAAALAARLDRPARDAGYVARANGSLAVSPGADGASVDRAALAAALRRAIVDPGAARTLAVATVPVPPGFGTAQAERDAPLLTRIGFAERYHESDPRSAVAVADLVLPPGASFAGDALPARPAEALFAAALAAGYATEGVTPGWRNDTAYPVFAHASVAATSVAWELRSVPLGRQVSFDPSGPDGKEMRRTVTQDGAVLSTMVLPVRFAPLQAESSPARGTSSTTAGVSPGSRPSSPAQEGDRGSQTGPITGTPAGR